MKTLIFTIVIVFSFSIASAQKASNDSVVITDIQEAQTSKISFYKVLTAKFNAQSKDTKKVTATNSKADFYNVLIEKNGLNTIEDNYAKLADKKSILGENFFAETANETLGLMP